MEFDFWPIVQLHEVWSDLGIWYWRLSVCLSVTSCIVALRVGVAVESRIRRVLRRALTSCALFQTLLL